MDLAHQNLKKIDGRHPEEGGVSEAVGCLREGRLIVLPTETVYGLAGDLSLPGVLERIYQAKGRPEDKPIPLLVDSLERVEAMGVCVSARARRLAERFWPGPLTLVLKTGEGFKGFRVPDDPVALAVLRRMGRALGVTSANRSGEPPALTAAAALAAVGASVALVLDAGPSRGGVPSTVARVEGDEVEILRAGAIPEQVLLQ